MALLTLAAGIFFLVVVGYAGYTAVRAAIGMFRTMGAIGRSTGDAVGEVAAKGDEVARHAERLPAGLEQLSADSARFGASRAQLAFVLGRLADVRRTVTGLRAAVMGK